VGGSDAAPPVTISCTLSSMTISVVVPAYNEEGYLCDCLRLLTQYRTPDVCEIIVVDNASTDTTAQVASSFSGVRVVHESRKGLTQARQTGLQSAHGDLVAYVDADTHIPAHWFCSISREFALHPNMVCLSGPYTFYDLPLPQRMASYVFWRALALPVYHCVGYMVVGGNFAAKRSALESIGGFDSSIAFYGEDTDIARRLSACGTVVFRPAFCVQSSGRRFSSHGIVRIGGTYMLNYLSEVFLHRPFTRHYEDIR